ncbi:MAG: hypothetical protein LBJ71_04045 [Holosporaceae bacterium]|jgi:hypothetical protein|nr:hypothetical protein [Holosporaceae bacterium]
MKIIAAFSAALLATCCEGMHLESPVSTEDLRKREIPYFLKQACYKNPTLKSLSFWNAKRRKLFLRYAGAMRKNSCPEFKRLINQYNEKVGEYNDALIRAKLYSPASRYEAAKYQLQTAASLFVTEVIADATSAAAGSNPNE